MPYKTAVSIGLQHWIAKQKWLYLWKHAYRYENMIPCVGAVYGWYYDVEME
jgi:hypothetical protein